MIKLNNPTNRFHSIGIPSAWELGINPSKLQLFHVSIQLGFPARGNILIRSQVTITVIMFPFNWDSQRVGTAIKSTEPFDYVVSIQLGFPARGNKDVYSTMSDVQAISFHSIGIPSAWEPKI